MKTKRCMIVLMILGGLSLCFGLVFWNGPGHDPRLNYGIGVGYTGLWTSSPLKKSGFD